MSSLGTSKGVLEIAKFGVYVAVPVALTYLVATDSKTLKKLRGLVCAFSPSCLPESSLSSRGGVRLANYLIGLVVLLLV